MAAPAFQISRKSTDRFTKNSTENDKNIVIELSVDYVLSDYQ
jgi:hypothetical protein